MTDMMLGALHDPFGIGHMGITAENVAKDYNINREAMDAFALASQQRAVAAIEAGYFADQITPIDIVSRKQTISFQVDEHVRSSTTLETLQGLRPAFDKEGMVTAGNSSGINDGASAVTLGTVAMAEKSGKTPLAKIVSYGFGGVPARIMGMGPVPASKMALERAGLTAGDIDIVESNEAFAAQACAVSQELGFSSDMVNPNGGAIALGHPLGMSGARLAFTAATELTLTQEKYALVTMCIGVGQGIAMLLQRV